MNRCLYTDQDGDLWTLLAQTRDAMFKAKQKELNEYKISATASSALSVIQSIGNRAIPAEISRRLFREPHSISGLLNRMEKAGLVRKTKDLDKKNLVRVELTDKGYEAYYQSMGGESIPKIVSSLSDKDCEQLRSSLQTLRDEALKVIGVEPKMLVMA